MRDIHDKATFVTNPPANVPNKTSRVAIIHLTRATTKVLVRRIHHIHNQPRDYRNTPDDRFSLVNLKPKGMWSESDREGKGREATNLGSKQPSLKPEGPWMTPTVSWLESLGA